MSEAHDSQADASAEVADASANSVDDLMGGDDAAVDRSALVDDSQADDSAEVADASFNSVDDLMGGDDAAVDRSALVDDDAPAEDGATAPLGDDVLDGTLASPRASPRASPAAAEAADVAGAGEEEELTAEEAVMELGAVAGGGEDVGKDDGADRERAASKIQARQRGARDRQLVEQQKADGSLPGQRRAVVETPVHRDSEKSVGGITFYDGIGSKYSGELLNGRPHGKGTYTFVNGNIYEGDFINGQFHGDGKMIFPGYGTFKSKYENGRAQGGQFYFEDGLEYEPQSWPYCVEGDRRFYHEVVDPRFGLTD
jgi:hypothetical protein